MLCVILWYVMLRYVMLWYVRFWGDGYVKVCFVTLFFVWLGCARLSYCNLMLCYATSCYVILGQFVWCYCRLSINSCETYMFLYITCTSWHSPNNNAVGNVVKETAQQGRTMRFLFVMLRFKVFSVCGYQTNIPARRRKPAYQVVRV